LTYKIKAVTFLILPLLACLFSDCKTVIYYDYVFTKNEKKSNVPPQIAFDNRNKSLTYITPSFETRRPVYGNIYGGSYELNITIAPSDGALIKNIFINDAIIYVGDNIYSMKDKIKRIWTLHKERPYFTRIEGDDLLDINSRGIINITDTFKPPNPDINYTFTGDVDYIMPVFQEIEIDFNKYKEIQVALDISVEFANGKQAAKKEKYTAWLEKRKETYLPAFIVRLFPSA